MMVERASRRRPLFAGTPREVQSGGDSDVFEELFVDDFIDDAPQPSTPPGKSRGANPLQHRYGWQNVGGSYSLPRMVVHAIAQQ